MKPFEKGQDVEVRWEGDQWVAAIVYRVYDNGADCLVGTRGCFYVLFDDIRAVTA